METAPPEGAGRSAMRMWWRALVCGGCVAVAGCDDECSAETRVALQVAIVGTTPFDKVTAELEDEEDCGSFRDPDSRDIYFTCWEQGGGAYTLRIYSGDTVLHERQIEIEADKCHIKERVSVQVDLDKD